MIPDQSEDVLNDVARGLVAGHIYTDRHCGPDVALVFLPLGLMEREELQKLVESKPGLIYERIDKAGPMSVNGRPQFFSLSMLNESDAAKVFAKCQAITEATEAALKPA